MTVTCTLAQINPTTGDVRGNTAAIIDALQRADAAGDDVVVFPEMAITGYCILDLIEDETFVTANRRALERIRDHTTDTAAVVGFIDRDRSGTYNAAAVLQAGEIKGIARKVLLPNYRYFDDARYFDSGGPVAPITIEVDGRPVSLGVSVCEDMWDSGYDRRPIPELGRQGAEVIVSVNASPFETGKREVRSETIQRHVAETGLPFLYVNTVGVGDVGENVVVFDGDSLVFAADGSVRAHGARFSEDRVTVTVDPASGTTDCPPRALPTQRRATTLYEALVLAIRDYTQKMGFDRVTVPLSGHLDSALGLAVCVEALGPSNVAAYSFPSPVDVADSTDAAAELARNFGVDHRIVPIEPLYEAICGIYEGHVGPIQTDAGGQTATSGSRGILTALASRATTDKPAMTVSTQNETELVLGSETHFSDVSVGLNLLGDLSRRDVCAVARYVNERYGRDMIPRSIVEGRSTARGQSDLSDSADEWTLGSIVDELLEGRCGPAEIVARFLSGELDVERYGIDDQGRTIYDRYDAETFEQVVYDTYRKLRNTAIDRVRSPPIVAVSGRAFGTDFREPVINAWDGRIPEWSEPTTAYF